MFRETLFRFVFSKLTNCFKFACSFVDNKEKLNEEEIEFVEDPANAGLFDNPPSSKKRTRDDQPSPNNSVGPAKRGKPSGDEVR